MNTVVFIKQVPDTDDVKWTKENNIDRTQMESIINPQDKLAIETALKIKEENGCNITAVTMGPSKAEEILHEAIAMGCDDAVLLCDSKFAGSDTNATSKVLAAAVSEKFKDTDLILCGQTAIDGETGQTGISLAARLDIPYLTNVCQITSISETDINVITETEHEKNTYCIKFPAVLCINNCPNEPIIPKIQGYMKAKDYVYKTYNMYDLNIKDNETGVKGSPTYVNRVFKNDDKRICKFIDTKDEHFSQKIKEEIIHTSEK